ncbi:toll/interleukin-1 receptor domain-containing protein [Metapseudomonas otitidis]|uniref:toll/interleukin-1 receptor domain-containing protein n=1 Tax=Metapseudomonas otitidis TaxID=319939 RepID=UPI002097F270|nr:toll/interleukin-1 receptor domain-containing protein [Pseudomonas otitidis]MCO7555100.1 toll/interleukin-1 receptor domain-containing protein [Pseudomonas otitidis]
MAVFISYSHADQEKIDMIAGHLVRKRASVWIDRWELKPGDSLINRIQEAVEDSSALLIMLSNASVASEWCKKELTAGLLRELEERRVVTIPVLLEDCKIPLFLRDKMYADFRKDFDFGMNALLEAVAGHVNSDQSRLEDVDGYLDWAMDWSDADSNVSINYTLVQNSSNTEMTFLTQIFCLLGDIASARYRQYQSLGIDWVYRTTHALSLYHFAKNNEDMFVVLENTSPKTRNIMFVDPFTRGDYEVKIVCRKMGNDNGKDQLLNIAEYLERIVEFTEKTNRKPTSEEVEKIKIIAGTPWPSA